jgi:hypothetical protein
MSLASDALSSAVTAMGSSELTKYPSLSVKSKLPSASLFPPVASVARDACSEGDPSSPLASSSLPLSDEDDELELEELEVALLELRTISSQGRAD